MGDLSQGAVRVVGAFPELLEYVNGGMWVFDRDWRFVALNAQGEQLAGMARLALLGKPLWEAFPELCGGEFERQCLEAMKSSLPVQRLEPVSLPAGAADVRAFACQEGLCLLLCPRTLPRTGEAPLQAVCFERKPRESERTQTETLREAINSVNQLVHSTLDVDKIMRGAISQAARVMGCETAAVSLRKGARWVVSYAYGFGEEVIGSEMNDEQEPHAVLALRTRQPQAISNAFEDERVNCEHMKKWGVRSVLVVPLIARDEATGVLFFNYHSSVFNFTSAHVDFGVKLAATISLALENARLFGDLQRELAERKSREMRIARLTRLYAVLSRVNEAIVRTRDQQVLYGEVCRIVDEEGEFPLVWIGRLEGRRIVPAASSGSARAYLELIRVEVDGQLGKGPTGTSVREARTVISNDFLTSALLEPWHEPARKFGFGASAAFPLLCQGEVTGVLTLYAQEADVFDAEQVALLEALCADVSYALEAMDHDQRRAQAEEALRKSVRRFELLTQTAGELLRVADPQRVVDSLCRRVMEYLDCQAFFNYLLDDRSGRLHLNACAGIPDEEARRIEWLDCGTAVCGCVARDGRRIVAEHIRSTPDERTELVSRYGVEAYACHPLLGTGGKLIGTLSFGSRTRHTFDEDDLSLMQAVADQVAVAMVRMSGEQALAAAKTAAEEANRAKDQFLAVLSHELRTPLNPVLTAACMMLDEEGLDAEQRDLLEMIRRNVELEARLIDDLLDLTRISRGKLELQLGEVDAHEKLRQVIGMCEEDIRAKGLQVLLDTSAGCHAVRADEARLQQIFWNLLKNAIKFTPAGGRITLTTANAAAGQVTVEVEDTGVGIDPELLPRIFDAFEQGGRHTTRQFGGLGLGLAICKGLVTLHGGSIAAESPGRGSGARFIVTLPTVGEQSQPSAAGAASQAAADSSRRHRVLLVEDHPDTALLMARVLRKVNLDVSVAHSVAEALAAARSETFELLVSDIGLPDGSGLDLMEQLRRERPIRGIALSGYGMEEDVQRSKRVGFDAHLVKPVSIVHLRETVSRLLSDEG